MRWILFFLPILLYSQDLEEILKNIKNSELLKSKEYQVRAKQKLYKATKGKNLPKVDISVKEIYLKDKPVSYMEFLGKRQTFQIASKRQYTGEISISYPLFSGFAIFSLVKKSKLEYQKEKLLKDDLKRKLYLQAVKLYGDIFAIKEAIKATKEAKKALNLSQKKAKGFFKQGLIPISEVYKISSKLYQTQANLKELESTKNSLLNMLSYMTKTKIKDIGKLKGFTIPKKLSIKNREDILALKKALEIDSQDIKLAKSKFYPTVAIKASKRKYGDDISLTGDGFRNADQSYVAVSVEQNLFNGFFDKETLQAMKLKKLARVSYIRDYEQKVKTLLENEKSKLNYLYQKQKWAKKELQASKSYLLLVKGRFQNQLCSGDELSRAIADFSKSKANLAKVKSEIFTQKAKMLLQSSLKRFEKLVFLR